MTRLGQPPDESDLAEEAENRRLAGLTPLSKLAAPPGVETIQEAEAPGGLVGEVAGGISEGEQVAAGVARVVPVAFRYEHYAKMGLAVLGAVLGAVFAIVDPSLQPIAIAVSGGSVLFGGAEVHAHSKGP